MIEVILSNGDRAEAVDPASAVACALQLMYDAADRFQHQSRETASFLVDGRVVRAGVTRQVLYHERNAS